MKKTIFFYVILIQFVISFFVAIFGVIGWVTIPDDILRKMAWVLIIEQAAAVIVVFKSTDFFDSKSEPNEEGWDLLATLWKYQVETAGKDKNKRWYIGIQPVRPEFRDFAIGLSRLFHLNLLDAGNNYEVSLSNKGYQFCEQNQEKLKKRKRLFHIT